MGDYITISEGLFITFISIISVFIILVLISFLIMGLKNIGGEEKEEKTEKPVLKTKKEEIPQESVKETYEEEGLDEELVAVIASALACSMGLDLPDINIKSIKRISRDTDEWSKASKVEQVSKTIY